MSFKNFVSLVAKNFTFVCDETLRTELSRNLAYTFKLMKHSDNCTDSSYKLLIDRDIAIHIGSITEMLLLYALQIYDKHGLLVQKQRGDKKYNVVQIISQIPMLPDGQRIALVNEEDNTIILNSKVQFIKLNRLALRSGLLTKNLFEDAEFIREERNKIHSKQKYTIDDVKTVFKTGSRIKRHIVKKLKELK